MPESNEHARQIADRRERIVVLIGDGPLCWILANAVAERFGPIPIIVEGKEPTRKLLRRRWRMLGATSTIGQAAFGAYLKLIHRKNAARIQRIIENETLKTTPPDTCDISYVPSVNTPECRDKIASFDPDVVFVVGTRMIRAKTLNCTPAPFINYHAGLNPKYRGMNGGYWAHANGDSENFGITVHLIDRGVDTGGTLAWKRLPPMPDGSIVTYPFAQAAAARDLVVATLERALAGDLATDDPPLPSRQWFHPTLWGYFWTGLTRGVW
jgi:folate-dependent phosphoribosylglycinamide formyltransferase PurN